MRQGVNKAMIATVSLLALISSCGGGTTLGHLETWGSVGTTIIVEQEDGIEIEVPAQVSVRYLDGEEDGIACVHVDESPVGTGVIAAISHPRCTEVLPAFSLGLRLGVGSSQTDPSNTTPEDE